MFKKVDCVAKLKVMISAGGWSGGSRVGCVAGYEIRRPVDKGKNRCIARDPCPGDLLASQVTTYGTTYKYLVVT